MKITLYPKTARIKNSAPIVTEKLDGSNLGFFKLNGELIIAQRNNMFTLSELTKENSYKGLVGWIKDNESQLDFCEGSGVFGEWIGMGKLKYGEALNKKFYIFAKANINDVFEIRNLNYDTELFIYPFELIEIPECMGIVPTVEMYENISIDSLDELYILYKRKIGRDVEGFIVNNNNQITKYVRHKNGKLTDHF